MIPVKIHGLGYYLPEQKVTSNMLDDQLGLPHGSVEKKSGLLTRHFASEHETATFMGAKAATAASTRFNKLSKKN